MKPHRNKPFIIWMGLLFVLGIAILALYWPFSPAPTSIPIPPVGGESLESFHFAVQPLFRQIDSRWRSDKMGTGGDAIGFAGCTICCISMALAHYEIDLNPAQLNTLLNDHDGYTKRGWVIWHKVSEMTNQKVLFQIPEQPQYEIIDNALKAGQPVIAKIFIHKTTPHWILIVGKDGQEYWMKDPLGKDEAVEKLSKYNSDIYSIRIVKRDNP